MADARYIRGPLSALGLSVIATILIADQASKAIAENTLPYGATIEVLPFLALHRVYNPGIAFSFLTEFGDGALIALVLAVTVAVLFLWARTREGGNMATVAYALIVGGAVGNLIDRLVHGHVIDFLLLHIGDRPLFVFNLADAALTGGPALLIIMQLWPRAAAKR